MSNNFDNFDLALEFHVYLEHGEIGQLTLTRSIFPPCGNLTATKE